MQYNMSIEELSQLKRGDHVIVQGKLFCIVSKGKKWIYLKNFERPINMQTGLITRAKFGSGDEFPIFKDMTSFLQYTNYLKKRADTKQAIYQLNDFSYRLTDDLLDDLHKLFIKHGVIK
jgi:hypothetical protein